MGDAALKLARRALASDGTDGPRNAAQVLRYYVDREESVANDARVWAALHYLYGQLGDSTLLKECCAKIEVLRGNGRSNMSNERATPILPQESVPEVEMNNDELSAEAKKLSLRITNAFERSDSLRAKATQLFEKDYVLKEQAHGGRLDGLLWKSRLLRQRGNILVSISDGKDYDDNESVNKLESL